MTTKDVAINLRVPQHVKDRLQRSGKLSDVVRLAIDQWIDREDRVLKRARLTLESAGIFDRVWDRLGVTGPSRESARSWARSANIPIESDAVEAAITLIIHNGY